MSVIERYRTWFEQEQDSNLKMIGMLESVPADRRSEPSFHRSLVLAHHLAACRENWLDRMVNDSKSQTDWWPQEVDLATLRDRYRALEDAWSAYLASLTDDGLDVDFDFPIGPDKQFRWNIEGQIQQLIGHSFYHRGQIALLVEQLGGTAVDTDYLYWATAKQPDRWRVLD
ncbi:MAG: DinB family protein [Armatimonadetes bacterium]|nr:DinB family protein [Armatimonadota bacterium]